MTVKYLILHYKILKWTIGIDKHSIKCFPFARPEVHCMILLYYRLCVMSQHLRPKLIKIYVHITLADQEHTIMFRLIIHDCGYWIANWKEPICETAYISIKPAAG